jgi:hypothetical protein
MDAAVYCAQRSGGSLPPVAWWCGDSVYVAPTGGGDGGSGGGGGMTPTGTTPCDTASA